MTMMLRTFCAAFLTLLLAGYGESTHFAARDVTSRAHTPRFEDMPVAEKFNGKPAPVKLSTAEARRYRTVIREGAREGPNFAGHYTIVTWGCGAGCVQFAIVDAKTGAVYSPRFYVAARVHFDEETQQPDEPLQFRIGSKLLIVSGSPNEKNEGIYYYSWDGKRLALIKSAAVKEPSKNTRG
jgi:hypothetical protein